MAVQRSVVKWFDAKKGYGFINHPDGGGDVFVHYSSIDTDRRFKTLRTGQVVEFELNDGPKGLHAQDVVPFDEYEDLEEGPLDVLRHDGHDGRFGERYVDGHHTEDHHNPIRPPVTSGRTL